MLEYLKNILKEVKSVESDLWHCDIDFVDELLSLDEIQVRLKYEIAKLEEEDE